MSKKFSLKTYLLSSTILLINPSCAQNNDSIPTNENVVEIDGEQYKEDDNFNFSNDELIGKASIDVVGKDYKLRPEAAKAFEQMRADAKKAGFLINVVSSYRNYTYQNGIWERKYKANQSKIKDGLQNIKKIVEYSTIPGTSRHHWGTDLDIIDASKGYPKDPLNEKHFNEGGQMHEFKKWLDANSEKYGFYLVYTNDPNRKGFKYEPWHFSYKPISQPMLKAYQKLDVQAILKANKLLGSDHFTDEFIKKYIKENILDINPDLK